MHSLIEAISGCQSWKLLLGSVNTIACNTRLRVLLPSLFHYSAQFIDIWAWSWLSFGEPIEPIQSLEFLFYNLLLKYLTDQEEWMGGIGCCIPIFTCYT